MAGEGGPARPGPTLVRAAELRGHHGIREAGWWSATSDPALLGSRRGHSCTTLADKVPPRPRSAGTSAPTSPTLSGWRGNRKRFAGACTSRRLPRPSRPNTGKTWGRSVRTGPVLWGTSAQLGQARAAGVPPGAPKPNARAGSPRAKRPGQRSGGRCVWNVMEGDAEKRPCPSSTRASMRSGLGGGFTGQGQDVPDAPNPQFLAPTLSVYSGCVGRTSERGTGTLAATPGPAGRKKRRRSRGALGSNQHELAVTRTSTPLRGHCCVSGGVWARGTESYRGLPRHLPRRGADLTRQARALSAPG